MKKAPRRAWLKSSDPATVLRVEPGRQLSGPVAARALRQHGRQGAELRIVDVRLGWREIQAVNGVGKRCFEPQPVALANAEVLRQSQICADEVWPLQDARATIAKSSGVDPRAPYQNWLLLMSSENMGNASYQAGQAEVAHKLSHGLHPHVARTQHGVGRKLPLDSPIPLRRLRIAEMRIVGPGSGSRLRELVQRRLQHAVSVVNRIHIGERLDVGLPALLKGGHSMRILNAASGSFLFAAAA